MVDRDITHPYGWTGEERRGIDGVTLKLMTEVRVAMEAHEKKEEVKYNEIKAEIKENRLESDARHAEVLGRFEQMQSSTMSMLTANNSVATDIHRLFKEAFPEGDVAAHRKAHEQWIKKDNEDRMFWLKLKQSVVNWVVLAIIGWGGIALWTAFLQGPK